MQQNTTQSPEAQQRRTLYQRLHLLSLPVGILLGILLFLISIPIGNGRELFSLTSAAQKQWKVQPFIDGRVAQVENLVTVAERYTGIDASMMQELREAQAQMKHARNSGVVVVSAADRRLQAAFTSMIGALEQGGQLTREDKQLIVGIIDAYNEQGTKLGLQAREYNRLAQLAINLYEKLPTRWLFPKPAIYIEP